jgi:hypothetical protein
MMPQAKHSIKPQEFWECRIPAEPQWIEWRLKAIKIK